MNYSNSLSSLIRRLACIALTRDANCVTCISFESEISMHPSALRERCMSTGPQLTTSIQSCCICIPLIHRMWASTWPWCIQAFARNFSAKRSSGSRLEVAIPDLAVHKDQPNPRSQTKENLEFEFDDADEFPFS